MDTKLVEAQLDGFGEVTTVLEEKTGKRVNFKVFSGCPPYST